MRVAVTLRPYKPDLYPYEAVVKGIQAAGDTVNSASREAIVTWNNYGAHAVRAAQIRSEGGLHVCMENGYMRREWGYFIMSQNGFNGTESNFGAFWSEDRFQALDLTLKPPRSVNDDSHILVCGQRGGGYSPLAMPNTWPDDILQRLRRVTRRELLYRPHPERNRLPNQLPENTRVVPSRQPLAHFLKDCWAVVVFTSNAATEALLAGVPVFYDGPTIAAASIARNDITQIEKGRFFNGSRYEFFCKLAHQQYSIEEIERGEAWRAIKQRL